MLQETTAQKTSQEEEISELTKKLKLSENQIFELTQKNKIIQTEQNQINIEIKSEYKTKLEEYKNQIDNLNQIIKGKTNGNLILLDVPNENCNWMLFESYQNLDVEKYTDTKLNGLAPEYEDNVSKESEKKEEEEQKNESDENKEK